MFSIVELCLVFMCIAFGLHVWLTIPEIITTYFPVACIVIDVSSLGTHKVFIFFGGAYEFGHSKETENTGKLL